VGTHIDDRIDRLEARLAALEAENDELRARLDRPAPPVGEASSGPPSPAAVLGRRDAVKRGLGLAGAAAAGAVLLDAAPAAAADGDTMKVARSHTAAVVTSISSQSNGFLLSAGTGYGMFSSSRDSYGVVATGGLAGLRLGVSGSSPPSDTRAHLRGELYADTAGTLWFCLQSGAPGTWRSLGGGGPTGPSAGAFTALPTPVRAYDSRPGTPPAVGTKAPIEANTTRTIALGVAGSGIDATVSTVVLNLLLVNTTAGSGNATVWKAGTAKPQSNSIVYGGNAGRFSTVAISAVDTQGRVQVHSTLRTHLVIDVVGVYR